MERPRQVVSETAALGVVLFVVLGLSLTPGCNGGGGSGSGGAPAATPTPTTMVAIPTATVPAVSRVPGAGVSSSITGASISGGEISVTFSLTDAEGVPIEPLLAGGGRTDSQARVRFVMAHVEEYEAAGELGNTFTRYVNDIDAQRPRYDGGGTLETLDAAAGLHRYTFATRLPEDFDTTLTYTAGIQVDREFEGEELSANPVFDFVPAGGSPVMRAGSTTAQCNSCHDPLQLHGNRREFRLCTLCHAEGAEDAMGRNIGLRVMIHKIHRGVELPSVADGEPGAFYGIFSNFQQQDIVFAEKQEDGNVTGVAFPRNILACETCHSEGPTAHLYLSQPSTPACTSCHDDVNPSLEATDAGPPGAGHFQNRGYPEGDCVFCHTAEMDDEFDVSVPGAHVIPERSEQLAGLNVEIVGVDSHAAGQSPVVSFKVTENDGEALEDLSGLNRLALTFSGPTSDYAEELGATAVGGGASGTLDGPDGEGVFAYTPAFALPETARGTWAVGIEARRSVELEAPEDAVVPVTEAARNTVVTFTADDSEALARRVVVADANCAECHGEFSRDFSIHGGLRNQIEYCVLCHNANLTDYARRRNDAEAVAAGDGNAPVDFKVMIHKIHRGEELDKKPYLVYGFGSAPANFTAHDFSEVLFPGDLRNCETCHVDDTYLLPPFPGDALRTRLTRIDPETGDEVEDGSLGPITAVCTSCHDRDASVAHAATQMSGGAEACLVCHMEGRDVAVPEAHAR